MNKKQVKNLIIAAVIVIAIIWLIRMLSKKKAATTATTPIATPINNGNAAGYPSGPSDTTPWVNTPAPSTLPSLPATVPASAATQPSATTPVNNVPVSVASIPVSTVSAGRVTAPTISNIRTLIAQQATVQNSIVPTSIRRF